MGYLSKKKQDALCVECLDELYQNCTPPITFGWLKFLYEDDSSYLTNHKIKEKKYDEIVNKYKKLFGKSNESSFSMFLLSYAPTIDYETVIKP